jgi:predicted NUDIX family NTP pyrophosphohydrolase
MQIRFAMAKQSAGLLFYRRRNGGVEVFLVHPGGPFWQKKDAGAWSIPKGEFTTGEDPLQTAKREFREETGFEAVGHFVPLESVKQAGGKRVHAWAAEGDFDPAQLKSSTFQLEWPPKSGKLLDVPEVDRAYWFALDSARERILTGQRPFLDELERVLFGNVTTRAAERERRARDEQ